MRLTRHAKNRLRWIQRAAPAITEEALLAAIEAGTTAGSDPRGNRRVAVRVDDIALTVVVDDLKGVVVTVWREG